MIVLEHVLRRSVSSKREANMSEERMRRLAVTTLLVLVAGVAGVALANVLALDAARADGPPCNPHHWYTGCVDGGWRGDVLCTQANVRVSPARPPDGTPPHDTIGGSGWVLWASRDDFGGVAINGGCGGPTSMLWYLLYKGWVHRSVLYTHR